REVRHVAGHAGVPRTASPLTQEGGGLHTDGAGTVLLTETVQLDPGRNPGWTRERVEAEVHARLGTRKAIWLPRGLTADYGEFGTRGHVDIVAAFTAPGRAVVHTQPDPGHPDHEVSREVIDILRAATDARGERIEVVELLAPTVTEADGELVDYSYVNHYVANGAVVLCAFDDPRDAEAAALLRHAYPGREVVQVDARDIFRFGGGIHCITQQQPLQERAWN
ncbi:agmatine deiminase family protein, partial [Spirillospora sp. NPDC049652]